MKPTCVLINFAMFEPFPHFDSQRHDEVLNAISRFLLIR
jgi:hypothetical protein